MRWRRPQPMAHRIGIGSAFSEAAFRLGLMKPRPSRETMTMATRVQNVESTSASSWNAEADGETTPQPGNDHGRGCRNGVSHAVGEQEDETMMPASIIIEVGEQRRKPMMVCTNTGMTPVRPSYRRRR